ncbi:MAG: class I SAM-dependent methyltransferase [Candidatus Eisenbacteria bacterium]|nr:class I SAM-dependent methyltransferase [Candidatus Eisenbacteria bacterium]
MASPPRPSDAVEFHSEIAADFHASYRSDANRRERVRVWSALLDRHAGGARFAYDFGCGSGVLACEIARRGIETVGIDGATGMLQIAEQAARNEGLTNLSFQRHRLPISDTSGFRPADIVISSSAIEYLDSISEALACLRDLTKPGGVVMVSVSNRDSVSRKFVRWVHRLTGQPRYFGLLRHFMTSEELRNELRLAELACVEHTYFGRADRFNRALSVILPPKYSSNMILAVAKRA